MVILRDSCQLRLNGFQKCIASMTIRPSVCLSVRPYVICFVC